MLDSKVKHLRKHTLFKGMTRPALLFGAPFEFVIVLLTFFGIFYIAVSKLIALALLAFGFYFGREFFKDDYFRFKCLFKRLTMTPPVKSQSKTGYNTYDPGV